MFRMPISEGALSTNAHRALQETKEASKVHARLLSALQQVTERGRRRKFSDGMNIPQDSQACDERRLNPGEKKEEEKNTAGN